MTLATCPFWTSLWIMMVWSPAPLQPLAYCPRAELSLSPPPSPCAQHSTSRPSGTPRLEVFWVLPSSSLDEVASWPPPGRLLPHCLVDHPVLQRGFQNHLHPRYWLIFVKIGLGSRAAPTLQGKGAWYPGGGTTLCQPHVCSFLWSEAPTHRAMGTMQSWRPLQSCPALPSGHRQPPVCPSARQPPHRVGRRWFCDIL